MAELTDREVLIAVRNRLQEYVDQAEEEAHVGPVSVLSMVEKHLREWPVVVRAYVPPF